MEKNDQLLLQLIYMLHTSAMQGLGKVADPTGQINRNLEYVSQTIDIMELLKVKVKGNISEEMITWKSNGTKIYQELPRECKKTLRECEPLREISEDQPPQQINFKPWKETKK